MAQLSPPDFLFNKTRREELDEEGWSEDTKSLQGAYDSPRPVGINSLQQAIPALFIHSLLSTIVNNLKENLRHRIALMTIQKNSMIEKSEHTGLAWALVGMQNIADTHMG